MSNSFRFYTCMFFWIFGVFLSSYLKYEVPVSNQVEISEFKLMSFFEAFFYILKTNILVGLLSCYLGYATAGFITIVILIFNGYIFGIAMFLFFKLYQSEIYEFNILLKLFGHVPFEIIALCLFGMHGLSGFSFIKNFIYKNEILIETPRLNSILIAVTLLTFAAVMETYSILNL